MRSVIYIDSEGNLTGLSDNLFDKLATLGQRVVKRVSNIEFNTRIQMWEAKDLKGNVIGTHQFREKLIEIERDYLNKQIENNYGANNDKFP
jgi:hypothetical protein